MASIGGRVASGLGLAVVLAFVYLVAYIPHLDTFGDPDARTPTGVIGAGVQVLSGERGDYPYTVHVDENVHWVRSASVQRQEKILIDDPFSGSTRAANEPFSLRGAVHEVGYWIILAEIQSLTGVSFQKIFQYLPALWMAFTAFAVYALVKPHPAALPAAAFVALIPTTARFLGPAFMVPIGFVLAWLPIVVILGDHARTRARTAILLAIVLPWAFFVHLIGGFAAIVVLVAYALNGIRRRRGLFALLLIALLPLLWLYNAFAADVGVEAQREESLPIDPSIFGKFGLLALFAWAVGVVLLELRANEPDRHRLVGFCEGGLAMLAMIVFTGSSDVNLYATYARWHHPFFLTAAVGAGFTVGVIAKKAHAFLLDVFNQRTSWAASVTRAGVAGILVVLLVVPGVTAHATEPYYHVISDEDWRAFETASANRTDEYDVFLTHPWKAPVLTALSGMYPRTWLSPGNPPIRGEEYDAAMSTGGSIEYYILNDVTVVVGPIAPPSELFTPIGNGTWLMKPEYAQRLHELRERA